MKLDLVLSRQRTEIGELIKKLEAFAPLVDKYRELQNIQLTQLQAKLLERVDDEDKLDEASLSQLVGAYNILKQRELVEVGKPTDIHGLVGYLEFIDKNPDSEDLENVVDADFEVVNKPEKKLSKDDNDYVPEI